MNRISSKITIFICFLLGLYTITSLNLTPPLTSAKADSAPSSYFSLNLCYEKDLDHGKEMAINIGIEMSKIGLKISVKEKSANDLKNGNFDVAIFEITETGLSAMLDLYASKGTKNYASISNDNIDSYLSLIQSATNETLKRYYVMELIDLVVWEDPPMTGLFETTDGRMVVVAFTVSHTRLSDRFVRLAIAHVLHSQGIIPASRWENCLAGLLLGDDYYPSEDEWSQWIGLPLPLNVEDYYTGEILRFQGHIRYELSKSWALMEHAGYDMNPFRKWILEDGGEGNSPHTEGIGGFSYALGLLCLSLVWLKRNSKSKHQHDLDPAP